MKHYDDEPVEYCESCLDLKVISMPYIDKNGDKQEVPYCGNCGSGDICQTDIDTWTHMYYDRYGHDYIKRNK